MYTLWFNINLEAAFGQPLLFDQIGFHNFIKVVNKGKINIGIIVATHLMTTEETQRNIARQLNDILSQMDRIINGAASKEDLENLCRYSAEFKIFLKGNTSNSMILERVALIPDMNFEEYSKVSLAIYLLTFYGGYLRDRMIRKKALADIKEAQGYYSSIQFLYKSEMA